ncbi:hypothetical protein SAMN05444921_1234 [Streptomyces wuyuanensis]|uniref:Uncharacterized protein n=1 Tax=Streptomyces wuyuanensis TaxID=1196353 RepID=A0A1G9ZXU0_9ACTN|nr:hypothetical protein SAMN05444921_1234 [Streptomyces wuyuanensis]
MGFVVPWTEASGEAARAGAAHVLAVTDVTDAFRPPS